MARQLDAFLWSCTGRQIRQIDTTNISLKTPDPPRCERRRSDVDACRLKLKRNALAREKQSRLCLRLRGTRCRPSTLGPARCSSRIRRDERLTCSANVDERKLSGRLAQGDRHDTRAAGQQPGIARHLEASIVHDRRDSDRSDDKSLRHQTGWLSLLRCGFPDVCDPRRAGAKSARRSRAHGHGAHRAFQWTLFLRRKLRHRWRRSPAPYRCIVEPVVDRHHPGSQVQDQRQSSARHDAACAEPGDGQRMRLGAERKGLHRRAHHYDSWSKHSCKRSPSSSH